MLELAAVARFDRHLSDPTLGILAVDLWVEHHADLVAVARYRPILKVAVKLFQSGAAVQADQSQYGSHRKLGLVHRRRIGYMTEHIDRTLVHVHNDRFHIVGAQPMPLEQLLKGVRRGVSVAT